MRTPYGIHPWSKSFVLKNRQELSFQLKPYKSRTKCHLHKLDISSSLLQAMTEALQKRSSLLLIEASGRVVAYLEVMDLIRAISISYKGDLL
jgi:hypothetical protein